MEGWVTGTFGAVPPVGPRRVDGREPLIGAISSYKGWGSSRIALPDPGERVQTKEDGTFKPV